MDLKKQMEMDLENIERQIKSHGDFTNLNGLGLNDVIKLKNKKLNEVIKLKNKKEIIEIYLKAFENDMVIEVGKKYKVKDGKYLKGFDECFSVFISDGAIITLDEILADDNIIIEDWQHGSWELDLETFKHMFEECIK